MSNAAVGSFLAPLHDFNLFVLQGGRSGLFGFLTPLAWMNEKQKIVCLPGEKKQKKKKKREKNPGCTTNLAFCAFVKQQNNKSDRRKFDLREEKHILEPFLLCCMRRLLHTMLARCFRHTELPAFCGIVLPLVGHGEFSRGRW